MEEKELNRYKFEFIGNGSDFFKIWITNTLLSIVTLGIYSPWAKVRNNQYLYGATVLNGNSFEYTADPIRILIGRAIVVGSYIFYIVLSEVMGYKVFATIFFLVFLLFVPFLVRQAVCFKMRYTRYRGVNFNHRASVWQYYKFFIIHTILYIITVGLIFPYTVREFKNLVISNTYYGDKPFSFSGKTSLFYLAYLKALGLLVVLYGSVFSLIYFNLENFKKIDNFSKAKIDLPPELMLSVMGIFFLAYFMIIFAVPFIRGVVNAWLGNITNNATKIHTFDFKSDWHPWQLGWIHLSNLIMNMFTMALLTPWAKIRILRHKLSHTYISGEGFDEFSNTQKDEKRALGEEAADFFDFDVGF